MPSLQNDPTQPLSPVTQSNPSIQADRSLDSILQSGEIASIYLGGTAPQNRVTTVADIPTLANVLLKDGSVPLDSTYTPTNDYDIAINQQITGLNSDIASNATDIANLQSSLGNLQADVSSNTTYINSRTYDFNKTINTLTTPVRNAGVYEIKMSMTWSYSSTTRSAYFRWSVNNGAWEEFYIEPKDSADRKAVTYMFPITTQTNDTITINFEGKCGNASDSLYVFFNTLVVERK